MKPAVRGIFVILNFCVLANLPAAPEALGLVEDGKSGYCIYRSVQAPATVKLAAEELQRVIKIATGVELAIVETAVAPMISLGENPAAEAAGIQAANIPAEGFRIVTKGGNLFIVGNDTPEGRQAWGATRGEGTSRGTLFGVYAFLEEVAGVRWLLPGPWGEDIPPQRNLRAPAMSLADEPDFKMRKLHCGQSSDLPRTRLLMVDEWLRRQRIGGSHAIWNTHSWYPTRDAARWNDYLPEDLFEKHPEYRAVDGDKGKFCTSNPAMVQTFAEGVTRWIDRHPQDRYFAMSPSDGGGFCRCPQCAALDELDPHGDSSCSPLVLKFYNEVARIVAGKHPDKMLAGYVYYNYMYPPQKPPALQANVHLVWAALEYYGFGLFKPKYRGEFERVSRAWSTLTQNFSYESWSCWMRSEIGAPLPPGIEILKLEIPTVKKFGAVGFHMVGLPAFGYGAPLNYLAAKLMWHAESNVDQLFDEWLERAYGPGWRSMKELFAMLDNAMQQNKQAEKPKHNYDITYDVVMDIYAPRFAQMERFYLAALARADTDARRQRLQMFGDNLVELHHYLRHAGLLAKPEESVFHRSDEAYREFLARAAPTAALNPTMSKALWVREIRKLTIPRLAKDMPSPRMDGDLSDVAWQQAATAEQFRVVGGREPCPCLTIARMLFDERNLYISFDCEAKRAEEILARHKEADKNGIYQDTTAEIFFSMNSSSPASSWWHLTVNALNTHWDGRNNAPAENLNWDSGARINGNRWTAEIAIPFASLNLSQSPYGQTWRGNLCRTYVSGQDGLALGAAGWNSLEERFAEPDHFGEWIFAHETATSNQGTK